MPTDKAPVRAAPWAWFVGLGFFALAGAIGVAPTSVRMPIDEPALVDASRITPGPLRTAMADPPTTLVGGFEQRCGDCHKLFKSGPEPAPAGAMVQHTNVTLNHGMNDRCLNCHDRRDREKLVGSGGEQLAYSRVPEMCARCHGTLYRDWQRGMHGKTLGSWDGHSGAQRRLICSECHSPHAPAYAGLEPLPAPDTLRMGDQHGAHASPPRSPLRQREDHH